jgi:hypothetical protein
MAPACKVHIGVCRPFSHGTVTRHRPSEGTARSTTLTLSFAVLNQLFIVIMAFRPFKPDNTLNVFCNLLQIRQQLRISLLHQKG